LSPERLPHDQSDARFGDGDSGARARARPEDRRSDEPGRYRWRRPPTRLCAHGRVDFGSIDIALKKAKTSIVFNGPSDALWDFCKPGGPAPATEYTNDGLIPYAGGVPVHDAGGTLIGAVGVSGGLPVQDGEVARAAAGMETT
jgi:hypothetical protein